MGQNHLARPRQDAGQRPLADTNHQGVQGTCEKAGRAFGRV